MTTTETLRYAKVVAGVVHGQTDSRAQAERWASFRHVRSVLDRETGSVFDRNGWR